MNFKKVLFLFLALLLPIAVFLFLKGFGKNEFAVEPLFQKEINPLVGCSYKYELPYTVSDSVLSKLAWIETDSLTLIVLNAKNTKKLSIPIERLKTELTNTIKFITDAEVNDADCVFLLQTDDNAVLIDSKKRIRGQYDLTDLADADRLIMETRIILKMY